ncbi:MAG: phage holin family protein [Pseudomonadota bacterium]
MSLSAQHSPLHHLETATAHVRSLLASEWRLARREVSKNLKAARLGIILAACGIALMLSATFALTAAAFLGLALLGMPTALAALVTSVGFFAVAAGLVWMGVSRLSPKALAPTETTEHATQTLRLVTEQIHVK